MMYNNSNKVSRTLQEIKTYNQMIPAIMTSCY